ncbi:hypothetical protein [Pelagimonas phthalicica]|uniref:hypothetical protein n=1 Tax=Pelagimonas phthalicica TaxID=1037362 RepID=UPI00105ED18E|nr:hypothetical protein [Pelagimonas phthalicica]
MLYDLDTRPFEALALGQAEVVAVEFADRSRSKTCLKVSFTKGVSEIGPFSSAFKVQTCFDSAKTPQMKALLQDPDAAVFGIEPGARVGLVLIQDPDNPNLFRYAVHSCFGFLSFRLDLPETDLGKASRQAWAGILAGFQAEQARRSSK